MRTAALLVLVLGAQDVPDHPDRLTYAPLRFEVPDPASMRTQLKGGATAYLVEDPSLPLVDVQVFVKAGSFADPKGREGLADLCASLMRTGGTATRSPEDLDRELDELAANLSVSLGDVSGAASLSVLAKDLDRGLELLFDVLRNPAFRQDKLDVLKAQTFDALKARNDSTASIESREASLLFYGDFPVNRLPTKASVESVAREDLAGFHRASFHPSRFIIAAAGAFKREALVAKLEAAFAGWPASDGKPPEVPSIRAAPKPAIYCFHKPGENINQGRVTIGHLGLTIHHPDVQAVRVMSYILGAGGFSSRLMQRVRTEEGLAYDVRSDLRPGFVYPFPFKLQFQSKSSSVAKAAKLCLEELARLREQGVSERELKAAQQFFIDAFPGLFFATRFQTASTYAQAELLGLPKDYYATYREKIAALTVDDIRRVAREHLHPDKFAWVVVGDIPTIKKGEGGVTLAELGPLVDVPLSDPLTLERPR
ncbi:MAG TPA: pitrilysin family protein [Planctomycetota bacterium]|nr:pitrilysin family protein [Planctomycetota bacterium]